jgi:hypothetical protein
MRNCYQSSTFLQSKEMRKKENRSKRGIFSNRAHLCRSFRA